MIVHSGKFVLFFSLAARELAAFLERKLRRKLQLPRIEDCPGRADLAAGTANVVAKMRWRRANEIRRSVNRKYFIHIRAVEQIECID